LVYGLVYDSEGGECLWAYGGIVYGPDLRLGYKNSKLAQQLQGVVSATLTVVNEIGVACTEHVLLQSKDSHRSLVDICSKSYQLSSPLNSSIDFWFL
jgi:hypothetical protein